MASAALVASATNAKTGAGSTVDFLVAKAKVSMVSIVNGTVTGGVVAVEGSHDGENWAKLHVMGPQTGFNEVFNLPAGAYRYFRSNILAPITGGGSVTTTFMEADA